LKVGRSGETPAYHGVAEHDQVDEAEAGPQLDEGTGRRGHRSAAEGAELSIRQCLLVHDDAADLGTTVDRRYGEVDPTVGRNG